MTLAFRDGIPTRTPQSVLIAAMAECEPGARHFIKPQPIDVPGLKVRYGWRRRRRLRALLGRAAALLSRPAAFATWAVLVLVVTAAWPIEPIWVSDARATGVVPAEPATEPCRLCPLLEEPDDAD